MYVIPLSFYIFLAWIKSPMGLVRNNEANSNIKGLATTTAPTIPFPTPPVILGPSVADPPEGSWPKRAFQPEIGLLNEPMVPECTYPFDVYCLPYPWIISGIPGTPDYSDENWAELQTICPAPATSESTSTTATTTSTTAQETATESPFAEGDPSQNVVSCYKKGEKTENVRMVSASTSFCNKIGKDTLSENYLYSNDYPFPYNNGFGEVSIKISWQIKPKCKFDYSLTEYLKYLSIPTDSCDCGGIDNKHGGIVTNDCYEVRIDPNLIF